MAAADDPERVEELIGRGASTQVATVGAIREVEDEFVASLSVGEDPLVLLTIELGERSAEIPAVVSRIAIPRVGDRVNVVTDPESGRLLYVGLAS